MEKTVFSKQIDESFVHMNLTSVGELDKYVYEKIVAKSERTVAMNKSDSIQTMEIFQAILNRDLKLDLSIYAGGI